MSVRTISIHSVREIDLEVSLAHVEQFQIEKSAAVGASGSFFLPPSLMQKLIHDPSSECEARDSGWTGRINGAARRLMRPYLTADRRVREKNKHNSRLQTTRAKHETHNCVQTRSGMRTAARVCAGCVRGEQFPPRAGAGGRVTGARMLPYACVCVCMCVGVCVCSLALCYESPVVP